MSIPKPQTKLQNAIILAALENLLIEFKESRDSKSIEPVEELINIYRDI
jgi:hypothetical protein